MKIGTILIAIPIYGAIYVCLGMFWAFCWFLHYVAFLKMEGCHRQFALMNDETLRSMAQIDWVAVHSWVAIAYVLLVIVSVAFLQIRGRPKWIYCPAAALFCIPCLVYLDRCAYIAMKFRLFLH